MNKWAVKRLLIGIEPFSRAGGRAVPDQASGEFAAAKAKHAGIRLMPTEEWSAHVSTKLTKSALADARQATPIEAFQRGAYCPAGWGRAEDAEMAWEVDGAATGALSRAERAPRGSRRCFIGGVLIAGSFAIVSPAAGGATLHAWPVPRARRPVVAFHADQLYLDQGGTVEAYVPPAGLRSLDGFTEEALRRLVYGL